MSNRLDYAKASPEGFKALGGVYVSIQKSGLPKQLVDIVYLRVSQSHPDLMWAWIYTDFKDPTRSNYGVYDWFRRVER